jgi:hypothetical protein
MAKIILIQGEQNTGKTATAGLVYQKLLYITGQPHLFYNLHAGDKLAIKLDPANKDSLRLRLQKTQRMRRMQIWRELKILQLTIKQSLIHKY